MVYPLRGAGLLNAVVVTRGVPAEPARSPADGARALALSLADWHPSIRRMVAASQAPSAWPLHEVADGHWTAGEDIALIGDAAHAMMPFAAQGAAMAIEDAFDLAESFTRSGASSLEAFARRRRERVARVRKRGDFNRFAYHARGPIRMGRDLVLAMRRPESLAADLDWLYGYRTPDA